MHQRIKTTAGLIVLAAIAMALVVGAALAVPAGPRGGGHGHRMGGPGVAQALGLTDAQKPQFQAIMADHRAKMQELRTSNLTPDEKKVQREQLWKETQSKIEAILTPEQRTKFEQMMAARSERREGFGQCIGSLNLTADRKDKIKSIRQDTMAQVKAIRSDSKLSNQDKMAKIAAVRKDAHKAMLAVLTPDQQSQLKACRKAHADHGAGATPPTP